MTSPTNIGEEVALTSFTLFSDPRFPVEMRRKIWKMAIPPPRLLKIKVTTHGVVFDPNYNTATWFPKAQDEEDLQRTHSQETILEVYKGKIESRGGRTIRFDAENDVILLENRCNIGLHDPIGELLPQPRDMSEPLIPRSLDSCPAYHKMFASIKNLAVDEGLLYGKIRGYEGWSLSHFESLETILILSTFDTQQYLITDEEQFTIQDIDQVEIPGIEQGERERERYEAIRWRDMWKDSWERLMALLLDYKKEFKPEWDIPVIRFKCIPRDS